MVTPCEHLACLGDTVPGGANDDERHAALLKHMMDVRIKVVAGRNRVDIHEVGRLAKASFESVIDMTHAILGIVAAIGDEDFIDALGWLMALSRLLSG